MFKYIALFVALFAVAFAAPEPKPGVAAVYSAPAVYGAAPLAYSAYGSYGYGAPVVAHSAYHTPLAYSGYYGAGVHYY